MKLAAFILFPMLYLGLTLPQAALGSDWEIINKTGLGKKSRSVTAISLLEEDVIFVVSCSLDKSLLKVAIATDKDRIDISGKTAYMVTVIAADGVEQRFFGIPQRSGGEMSSIHLYTVVSSDSSTLADDQVNLLYQQLLSAERPVTMRVSEVLDGREIVHRYQISHQGSTSAMQRLAADCGRKKFSGFEFYFP